MKLNKKNLMSVIVLTSICIVVAALMAIVNMFTSPVIEANALKKEQEALFEVLSTEKDGFDRVKNLKNLPSTVTAVYKAKGGSGYAVSIATSTNYSSGDMTFVVGIDNEGKVVGIKLNGYYESKSFGKNYPSKFVGKNFDDYDSVETVSGVTYSSTAFKSAVGDALIAVKIANGEKVEKPEDKPKPEIPPVAVRSDEELLALSKKLVGSGVGFEDVTPESTEHLRRLFRLNNGEGYVAYIVVLSPEYGTVETEELVYLANDTSIKKIQKLTWKTSDAIYGYVPPTQEDADAFYSRLTGSNIYSVDDVQLVSNATNTSTRVVESMTEAMEAVKELEKSYAPRIIGIIVLLLAIASFVAALVYNRKRRAPNEK